MDHLRNLPGLIVDAMERARVTPEAWATAAVTYESREENSVCTDEE
jgi:hypothetical protein